MRKATLKIPSKLLEVSQHPSFMATNLQANINEKTRTQSLSIKEASSLYFEHGGSIYLTLIFMHLIYSSPPFLPMKDN